MDFDYDAEELPTEMLSSFPSPTSTPTCYDNNNLREPFMSQDVSLLPSLDQTQPMDYVEPPPAVKEQQQQQQQPKRRFGFNTLKSVNKITPASTGLPVGLKFKTSQPSQPSQPSQSPSEIKNQEEPLEPLDRTPIIQPIIKESDISQPRSPAPRSTSPPPRSPRQKKLRTNTTHTTPPPSPRTTSADEGKKEPTKAKKTIVSEPEEEEAPKKSTKSKKTVVSEPEEVEAPKQSAKGKKTKVEEPEEEEAPKQSAKSKKSKVEEPEEEDKSDSEEEEAKSSKGKRKLPESFSQPKKSKAPPKVKVPPPKEIKTQKTSKTSKTSNTSDGKKSKSVGELIQEVTDAPKAPPTLPLKRDVSRFVVFNELGLSTLKFNNKDDAQKAIRSLHDTFVTFKDSLDILLSETYLGRFLTQRERWHLQICLKLTNLVHLLGQEYKITDLPSNEFLDDIRVKINAQLDNDKPKDRDTAIVTLLIKELTQTSNTLVEIVKTKSGDQLDKSNYFQDRKEILGLWNLFQTTIKNFENLAFGEGSIKREQLQKQLDLLSKQVQVIQKCKLSSKNDDDRKQITDYCNKNFYHLKECKKRLIDLYRSKIVTHMDKIYFAESVNVPTGGKTFCSVEDVVAGWNPCCPIYELEIDHDPDDCKYCSSNKDCQILQEINEHNAEKCDHCSDFSEFSLELKEYAKTLFLITNDLFDIYGPDLKIQKWFSKFGYYQNKKSTSTKENTKEEAVLSSLEKNEARTIAKHLWENHLDNTEFSTLKDNNPLLILLFIFMGIKNKNDLVLEKLPTELAKELKREKLLSGVLDAGYENIVECLSTIVVYYFVKTKTLYHSARVKNSSKNSTDDQLPSSPSNKRKRTTTTPTTDEDQETSTAKPPKRARNPPLVPEILKLQQQYQIILKQLQDNNNKIDKLFNLLASVEVEHTD
jgi:hypothetical protein